jgi:hypothetical protein
MPLMLLYFLWTSQALILVSYSSKLLIVVHERICIADHDYRKAVVVANTLRDQRVSLYQSGYPVSEAQLPKFQTNTSKTLHNSTEQTLELVKSALLVHASLTTFVPS